MDELFNIDPDTYSLWTSNVTSTQASLTLDSIKKAYEMCLSAPYQEPKIIIPYFAGCDDPGTKPYDTLYSRVIYRMGLGLPMLTWQDQYIWGRCMMEDKGWKRESFATLRYFVRYVTRSKMFWRIGAIARHLKLLKTSNDYNIYE